MSEIILELNNISKTFNANTSGEKKALDNISFFLEKGDFVTIIGANGAGKSTLFNVICGTILPDNGNIKLNKNDITYKADHKRAKFIGRLFQDPMTGTAPDMTVEENLFLALGSGSWLTFVSKQKKNFIREKVTELNLGLEDKLNFKVGQLSGGQRQALTLLMATINPPQLLLLDEHTAALDPIAAQRVIEITNQIVEKEKLTCMMITHNMQSAIDIGNRLFMMDNGKIIADIPNNEKKSLSVQTLINSFKEKRGISLSNDRMLLH